MFNLLSKFLLILGPLGVGIFTFVKAKNRLVIEYVLIALLVTTAATTFTLWLQKAKTEQQLEVVQTRVGTLEAITEIQEATIGNLKELRYKDSIALDGLISDYKALAITDARVRHKLGELERTNETVRDYLALPIPADLACMLDKTCSPGDTDSGEGGAGDPSPGPGAAVPAAPGP